jgi:hypothetical protein
MAPKQPVNPLRPDVPRLATPAQVAKYLYTTEAALAQMRYMGNGPKFIKNGRRVLYPWGVHPHPMIAIHTLSCGFGHVGLVEARPLAALVDLAVQRRLLALPRG